MKKLAILTFLCFLIGSQNLCFSQQQKQPANLPEYCTGCLIAIAALAAAPNYDDYNTDRAFCRDSATFYFTWAGGLKWLGQNVTLPPRIAKCHQDIVEAAYMISESYKQENYLAVGVAKTALAVATVQMVDELNKLNNN